MQYYFGVFVFLCSLYSWMFFSLLPSRSKISRQIAQFTVLLFIVVAYEYENLDKWTCIIKSTLLVYTLHNICTCIFLFLWGYRVLLLLNFGLLGRKWCAIRGSAWNAESKLWFFFNKKEINQPTAHTQKQEKGFTNKSSKQSIQNPYFISNGKKIIRKNLFALNPDWISSRKTLFRNNLTGKDDKMWLHTHGLTFTTYLFTFFTKMSSV